MGTVLSRAQEITGCAVPFHLDTGQGDRFVLSRAPSIHEPASRFV